MAIQVHSTSCGSGSCNHLSGLLDKGRLLDQAGLKPWERIIARDSISEGRMTGIQDLEWHQAV